MNSFNPLFSFSNKEVKEAFKHASFRASIPGLKLLIVSNSIKGGKFLIIVPKSFGNAPKRNKIRRQLKSIYYQEKLFEEQLTAIILVYKEANNYSFDELKQFLLHNLKHES